MLVLDFGKTLPFHRLVDSDNLISQYAIGGLVSTVVVLWAGPENIGLDF